MNAGVVRLAARRQLSIGALVIAALSITWAATSDWNAKLEPLGELRGAADLTRAGIWSALCTILVPLCVARASGVLSNWRARELDWIVASPSSRASWLASTWLGAASSAAFLVALIALTAELRAGNEGARRELVATFAAPRAALIESQRVTRHALALALAPNAEGFFVRLELERAGGGAAADVRVALIRGAARTEQRLRVGLPTTVELAVPSGTGALQLELERLEGEAVVIVDPRELELVRRASYSAAASVALTGEVVAALSAAIALALGLAAWISAPSAFAVVAAAWLAAWLAENPPTWWPAGSLLVDFERVGDGLAPPPISWAAIGVAGALAAFGLAIGAAARWRRT